MFGGLPAKPAPDAVAGELRLGGFGVRVQQQDQCEHGNLVLRGLQIRIGPEFIGGTWFLSVSGASQSLVDFTGSRSPSGDRPPTLSQLVATPTAHPLALPRIRPLTTV
jgi:hypothetical protein